MKKAIILFCALTAGQSVYLNNATFYKNCFGIVEEEFKEDGKCSYPVKRWLCESVVIYKLDGKYKEEELKPRKFK